MSSSKPSRVSLIPPLPPERGTFKIEKREDGIMTATPTKGGKLAGSPSHVYDSYTKQWLLLKGEDIEDKSVVSRLSAISNIIGSILLVPTAILRVYRKDSIASPPNSGKDMK